MTAENARGAWPRPTSTPPGAPERVLRVIFEKSPESELAIAFELSIPLYRVQELCLLLTEKSLIENGLALTVDGRLHLLAAFPDLERAIVKQGQLPFAKPRQRPGDDR